MRLATNLAATLVTALLSAQQAQRGLVLVEAESFRETGGWVVDQQFMDFMGSPMLLANSMQPMTGT